MSSQSQSQLLQSRQTPVRGVTMRSPGHSGIKTSQNRLDYAQTRNLPSTNPIREPTPDLMPRSERIASTSVPNVKKFTSLPKARPTTESPQRNIQGNDVDEITEQFNRVLKSKNDQIEDLRNQLQDSNETVKRTANRQGPNESQVSKLVSELEYLNGELQKSRQNEIKLTAIVQNYENQIHQLSDQTIRQAQDIKELQQQNQNLISQFEGQNIDHRVSELQRDHAREVADLQNQLRDVQQLTDRNDNAQIERLRKQNQELVGELEKLAGIVQQQQQELQAKGDSHQLTLILQQRNQELDDLKNKVALLQDEKSKMEQKVVLMSTEIMRLENQVNIWKEHCNKIQQGQSPDQDKANQELQMKNTKLEGLVNELARENEKLNKLIEIKDKEVLDAKTENRRSNVSNRTIEALERELYLARGEISEKERQLQGLHQDSVKQINILTNELETVSTHLRTRNQEIKDLQQRYDLLVLQSQNLRTDDSKYNEQLTKSLQLGKEIEKLADIVRQQAEEIRNLRNQLAESEERNKQQQYLILQSQTTIVNSKKEAELEDALRRKSAEAVEWQQSFLNLQATKEREINGLMESLRNEIKNSSATLGLQNEYNKLKESAAQLTAQNEQLVRLNIEKENEIRVLKGQVGNDSGLRSRVLELENQLSVISNEIVNQRSALELKDREIFSLNRQLEESRQRFNPDIERQLLQARADNQTLSQLLAEKDYQISQLQQQLAQEQVEERKKKSKKDGDQKQLEDTIAELRAENTRLTTQRDSLAQSIDLLNRQLFELQTNSSNVSEMQRRIDGLLFQISDLEKHQRTLSEEREALVRQLLAAEALKPRLRELEGQVQFQADQIRRLQAELEESRTESVKRAGLQKDVHGYQVRIKELESQTEVLSSEINRLNSYIKLKENEWNSKNDIRMSQGLENQQLSYKISSLTQENERLQGVLREKQDEITRISLIVIEREKQLSRLPQLEERNAQSYEEISRLNAQIKYLTEDNIRKLIEENSSLRTRLAETSDFDRQKKEFETRILLLQQERERNAQTITLMSQEKLALQGQLNEFAGAERQLAELKQTIEWFRSEKERLERENGQLHSRLIAVSEIEKISLENEHRISAQANEIERLKQTLAAKNQENAQLSLRILELQQLEHLRSDLESKINILSNDNARLNEMIRRLQEENLTLQTRLAQLRDLENGRIVLENQINLLQADNQRVAQLVRAKDEELVSYRDIRFRFENLSTRNQEALVKLVLVQAEVERVTVESREKSNIILQLEQRLRDNNWEFEKKILEQRVAQQQQEITQLSNELGPLARKYQLLEQEKIQWTSSREQFEFTIARLNEEIARLRELVEDGERVKKSQKTKDAQYADSELQLKLLREQVERQANEISQYQRQIYELHAQLEQFRQSEARINLLTQQLASKTQEAENLLRELQRVSEAFVKLQQELQAANDQRAQYEFSVKDLSSRLEAANQELNRLNQQSYELMQRLASASQLESRNARLSEAYVLEAALSESLQTRVNELLAREGEIQESVKKSKKVEQDKENLLAQLKQQENYLQELNKIILAKDSEINQLKQQLSASSSLQYRVQQLEAELAAAKQQNEDLMRRLMEADARIRAAESKVLEIQFASEEALKKSRNSDGIIQQLESRIQQLMQELDRFRGLLADEQRKRQEAESQVYSVQAQAEEITRQLRLSESNMKTLEGQIQQLLQEIERLRALVAEEQQKRLQAENRLLLLQQETEDSVKKSRMNQSQMQSLESLIQSLQQELNKTRQIAGEEQQRRIEAEDKKSILAMEIERLNSILKDKLGTLEALESEKILLIQAIQRAEERAREFEAKAFLVDERNRTIEGLMQRLREYEARIAQLQGFEAQLTMLQLQLNEKNAQISRAEEQTRESEKRNAQLLQTIGQLQDRIRQLEMDLYNLQNELNEDKVKKSKNQKESEDLSNRLDYLSKELAARDAALREFANLENQIRMLTYEKDALLNERNQLNAVLLKLQQEKESALASLVFAKAALEATEPNAKNLQMQIQLLQHQLQAKDKEYRDLLNSYQQLEKNVAGFWQEKNALEQEVQRLRSELAMLEAQHNHVIQDLKTQMEMHLAEQLRTQLANAKAEYERRLAEALNAQQASYEDDLVKRSRAHKAELDNYKSSMEMTLRNELEAQLQDLQMRMELDRRSLEEEKRVLMLRVAQLEEQLRALQAQLMEALSHEQDSLKWKEIVERLEMQRQREIAEFRGILEESRNLQIDASASLQDAERTAYNTQIKQLSLRVSELMENLKVKDHENNELRASNANLIREKSEIKMQLSVSNAATQNQLEIDSLKRQIIQANDAKNDAQTQLKRTEAKISQYEIQISQLGQELTRANEQLNQRKNERDSAFLQLDQLKSQTLSISQAFSSAGGEADIQRSKFQVLQKEIEELTIQRNMYKEQSERKSDELNRKNLELVEKIGQLDTLKLKYQENSSKIYILETKLLDKLQTEEVHIM